MAPFLCPRPFGPPALALAFLAVAAAGCQTMHPTTSADTTGSVGLASALPVGARGGARPDGAARGSAPLLRQRPEARSRESRGALEPGLVLRACQGSQAGRDHSPPRGGTARRRGARAPESGAGGRIAGP